MLWRAVLCKGQHEVAQHHALVLGVHVLQRPQKGRCPQLAPWLTAVQPRDLSGERSQGLVDGLLHLQGWMAGHLTQLADFVLRAVGEQCSQGLVEGFLYLKGWTADHLAQLAVKFGIENGAAARTKTLPTPGESMCEQQQRWCPLGSLPPPLQFAAGPSLPWAPVRITFKLSTLKGKQFCCWSPSPVGTCKTRSTLQKSSSLRHRLAKLKDPQQRPLVPPLAPGHLSQKWADMFFKATNLGAGAIQVVTALRNLPSVTIKTSCY